MTNENRCEPRPEWRDRDGWYWMKKGGRKLPAYWTSRDEWWDAVHFSGGPRTVAAMGFSVAAPVTPPATVAALVEALERMTGAFSKWHSAGSDGALGQARAALVLYREAKR